MNKQETIKKYYDAIKQGYLATIYRFANDDEPSEDGFSTLDESDNPYCFDISELDDNREYDLLVSQK